MGLKGIAVGWFNGFISASTTVASRSLNNELKRRDAERGRHALHWLTPSEVPVAEALASIIVPSDKETPGLSEVDVLGPPAIVSLDRLIAESPHRQYLYSRGLLSFDIWAKKRHGCSFAEMSNADQIALFKAAEQIYESWTGRMPSAVKAWRRLRAIAKASDGSVFAAQLYPQVRNDCFQVFYTSRVSWVWLEYDGPPMDEGYPKLAPRH